MKLKLYITEKILEMIRNKRTTLSKLWVWIGISPSIVAVIVALIIPENVLQLLPSLQASVELMTSYFPAIGSRIAGSRIPEVVAATYLTSMLFLPFQIFYVPYSNIKYGDIKKNITHLRPYGWTRMRAIIICGAFLSAMVFYNLVIGISKFHYLGIDPVNSRLGLALIGGFGNYFLCLALAALLMVIFQTTKEDWE